MAGRQGYGVHSPESYKTCGRFRKGVDYPERNAVYFVKGFKGKNPKAGPPNEKLRKLKMKEEKRREVIKREARDIQDIAREHTEHAMKVITEIMDNDAEVGSVRLQAAKEIMDRAHGKPTITTLNANLNSDVKVSEVDAADLDKRIANALNRIEKLAGREIKTIEGQAGPMNIREIN